MSLLAFYLFDLFILLLALGFTVYIFNFNSVPSVSIIPLHV